MTARLPSQFACSYCADLDADGKPNPMLRYICAGCHLRVHYACSYPDLASVRQTNYKGKVRYAEMTHCTECFRGSCL